MKKYGNYRVIFNFLCSRKIQLDSVFNRIFAYDLGTHCLTVNMVLKGSLSDQICFYLINVIKQKMLFGIRMQSNGFIKKIIRFKEPYSTIGLQFGELPIALILQKMKSFMDKPCCQKNLNLGKF